MLIQGRSAALDQTGLHKFAPNVVSSLKLYRNKTVFRKSHPVINSGWHTKSKWNIDHLATSQYSAGTPWILASTWTWFNPLHPPKRCSRQNQNSSQFFMRVTRSFLLDLELQSLTTNPTLGSLSQSSGSSWAVFETLWRLLLFWGDRCYQDVLHCCKVISVARW